MRPGRELDCEISQKVFGRHVFVKKRVLHEQLPEGERPLRHYAKDVADAWEVAEAMDISLLRIEGGQWFAIAGGGKGWKSPADFIQFLQTGDFVNSGAAIAPIAAQAICIAALHALKSRETAATQEAQASGAQPDNVTPIH